MRVPESLYSLVEAGVIEDVLRPLLSGKEAEVFLVMAGGQERVAKIYKEAHLRSFKHRTDYTEGRSGRNSRDRRAVAKGSRYGRARDEEAWRSAEVTAIHKLWAAGVRVPEPYNYMDGVLVMELVKSASGAPAPRLGELVFEAAQAQAIFDHLLQEVVKMLCAGVVHADLSDFNILMSAEGPVIIDFPQVVDPASNGAAKRLLMRDVDNLQDFLARFVPGRRRPYAEEMWGLYESNQLTVDTQLRGAIASRKPVAANTNDVLALIDEAKRDEQRRRGGQGGPSTPRGRGRGGERSAPEAPREQPPVVAARGRWVEVKIDPPPSRRSPPQRGPAKSSAPAAKTEPQRGRGPSPAAAPAPAPATNDAPPRKRRRRRRKPGGEGSGSDRGGPRSSTGTSS